ncbi:squalene--hopene cyclase [Pseudalkalibacillus caeni]|uniref:Squalene--hopene cyclase n=1 Tax=Exobacillus caeni TaxID=2574798 RepID=A0A5R9F7I5_9BACL|nr:squalene--hopene cyclase [Pseudalkalibacillus caeni]TLS38991.1 squalene--hopene cyclase [Pseudalkalibacillus caeni]
MDTNLILKRIDSLKEELLSLQKEDGTWRFCFVNSLITDAYMIIVLRTLEIQGTEEEQIIKSLVQRLLSQQSEDGAWRLYEDEREGNLDATIQAYNALLFSGYVNKNDENMKKAEKSIFRQGGLEKAHPITKAFLAANGQFNWPLNFHIPIGIMLLPRVLPINFFDFSSYGRIHFAPLLVLLDKRFSIQTKWTPDLSNLHRKSLHSIKEEELRALLPFAKEMNTLLNIPSDLYQAALKKAEEYMLKRIESDGTLYSYATATFLMVYALLALDYSKSSPVLLQAVNGLKDMICKTETSIHVQNSPSTIWDTSLISYALQEAGISCESTSIEKANDYLLMQQHYKYGDWAIKAPDVAPGGWGFSETNSIHPDVDDTAAALRAITCSTEKSRTYRKAWHRGFNWVLGTQNSDGGWAAFEKDTTNAFLSALPVRNAIDVLVEPSTADVTGRTLEFLGNKVGLRQDHPQVKRAIRWLLKNQEKSGSWYGKWSICYIYGTWAALTGLKAVNISSSNKAIQKARNWLVTIQHPDGGWGESCKSDEARQFVPLNFSTPSQTSWALDALIACDRQPSSEIDAGIQKLVKDEWEEDAEIYPTGAGLPGGFYIHYDSYKLIWPLLTLSHYMKKYKK